MKVYIDSREQDRVQSATDYFEKHHLEVYTRELDVGDYVFTYGSDSVVFEFKTMKYISVYIYITFCKFYDYISNL